MQNQTTHKEFYHPFGHYTRGILFLDEDVFKFRAYRVPYLELDQKTWETEQEFVADYRQLIVSKYSI